MRILIYDTETTGKVHKDLSLDHDAQPNLVQLAAILCDEEGQELSQFCCTIRPEGWVVPAEAAAIHGISDSRARAQGVPLISALALFSAFCANADRVVGHNLAFDLFIAERSYWQIKRQHRLPKARSCTMLMSKDVLQLPKPAHFRPNPRDPYKWPNLTELHQHCFGEGITNAHTAMADASATKNAYFWLRKQGVADVPPRSDLRPAMRAPVGALYPGETQRTVEFFRWVMDNVNASGLTQWYQDFISNQRQRLEQYGDKVMVSSKQWEIIEKIATLYVKVPAPDESAPIGT